MASIISKMKKKSDQPQEKAQVTAEKSTKTKKSVTKKNVATPPAARILLRPLVTEKGSQQQSLNKYFFEVERSANKIDIKRTIESMYKVDVVAVRVMNVRGKRVMFARRAGARRAWKKAIVTLKKGQRITTVEGV
ncbi:MAG: 50S ribosomal protein L23 [Patescibacteria group bacterium]